MTTSLAEIAFLANSDHRVAVLDALATTPRTRQELVELDGSRVTIARILRDLEARHWIKRTGQTYTVTPLGEWICDEFTRLLDVMETEHHLREVLQWFPPDELTFDIRRLRTAEIIRASESDPTAPIRRGSAQFRGGTDVRILANQVTTSFFDIVEEPVLRGEMTLEGVGTPDVYETIGKVPQMRAAFQELNARENTAFFVTEEEIPFILHIVDDSVLIGLTDDRGNPRVAVESTDSAIHSWAADRFETYAEPAEPITREELPA